MENLWRALILFFVILLIVACSTPPMQPELIAEELAKTMVAQTATANQVITSGSATETNPEATPHPSPVPISLPLAPTSIPVPSRVSDDFSTRKRIWGECEYCVWKDDALYFGPYPPRGVGQDQVFWVICTACGEHRFYRVAADVTYLEGYGGDRTYGILSGLSEGKYLGGGTITTTQHALYETFDFVNNEWGLGTFQRFGVVNPGRQTNHIEVTLKEGSIEGKADVNVIVNGETLVSHYNQEVDPTQIGLYLGWHSVAVKYDNFEFESFERGTESQNLWSDPGSVEADPFPQERLTNAPAFTGSEGFYVGGSSSAVTTGDFNSDGLTDLAVAVDSSNQSGVLLATGDGSFQPMSAYPIQYANDVETADFNRDGHQDLAFVSPGMNLFSVLLGDGQGDFVGPKNRGTNSQPRSLTVADFNLDDIPDIATANAGSDDVALHVGEGNGRFSRAVSVPVGIEPSSIDNADFNLDGNPDLAVVNRGTGDVSVLLGDGSGGFSPPTYYFLDFPNTLTTTDVNNDGNFDMVFANPNKSMISVMLGNGMGEFYVSIVIPTQQTPDSLVVADLNQDGVLDLAVANTATHEVSIYLGDGRGNFGLAETLNLDTYPVSLAVGDFNQDGLVDLAVANFSGGNIMELAQGKRVTASNSQLDNPCEYAVDSEPGTNWISNKRPPGWIEVDLGDSYSITGLTLDLSGDALTRRFVHFIEGKGSDLSDNYWVLFKIDDYTTGEKIFTFNPEEAIPDVRYIRIRTTQISGGNLRPAWSEIQVYGSRKAPVESDQDLDMEHVLILFQGVALKAAAEDKTTPQKLPTETPRPTPTLAWEPVSIQAIEGAFSDNGYSREPFTSESGDHGYIWIKDNAYERVQTWEDGVVQLEVLHDKSPQVRAEHMERKFKVLDEVLPPEFMTRLREANDQYNHTVAAKVSGEPDDLINWGDDWNTIEAEYYVTSEDIGGYRVFWSLWFWQSTCPSKYSYCYYPGFPGLEFTGDSSFVFYTIQLVPLVPGMPVNSG